MSTVQSTTSGSSVGSNDDAILGAVDVSDATYMENNFITLMVAQIQNQDPTEPVDSGQFLSQYSAMSQVRSLENMANLSSNNLVLMDNLQTLTAAGLVGQQVRVRSDSLQLDGETVSGVLQLQHAAGATTVTLTDSNGVSSEIQLGTQVAGEVAFDIDPVALGLRPGAYRISASTDNGEYPSVELAGEVGKVRVGNDGPVLDVAGIGAVPFYNITEFGRTTL